MAAYILTASHEPCAVIRSSDGASIPPDPANMDYAAYLAWKDAGNVPAPAPGPTKDEANAPILAQLDAIDAKSVRPLRAVLSAQAAGQQPDPSDVAYLANLKQQSDALRAQLVK